MSKGQQAKVIKMSVLRPTDPYQYDEDEMTDTDDELFRVDDVYGIVYHSFLGDFLHYEIQKTYEQMQYIENVFKLVRIFSGYDIYDYIYFEYEILGDYYYFRELLFKIEAFIQSVYYILPNDIIMIILLDGYNNYIKFN